MSIVHIHSPLQSIEVASMQQAAQLPVAWYLERLAANAAQATILPPGFADDITPSCFTEETGMAQPQFLIQVHKNKTRDAAIITAAMGSQEPVIVSKTNTKSGRTSLTPFGAATRIPEDADAVPLMRSGIDALGHFRLQVGAYIIRLVEPETMALVMGNFDHTRED